MVKILFTTDDIVKEFEVFAYLNGYDLRIIDIIVPMIRSENTILFKKDNQAGWKRTFITFCEWEEEWERLVMEWKLPTEEFLSSMARDYIKMIR